MQDAVLAMLAKEPSHGYHLRARLRQSLGPLGESMNPGQIKKYAVRAQTAYGVIRDAYGYHSFDDRDTWTGRQLTRQFRTFLHGRAWTHAEGPVALFEQSVAWLRRHRVLLPVVTVLERLVGSVRERADVRMYTVVAKQVRRADPDLPGALSGLLVVPEGSRVSEWRSCGS
ncbi:DUF4158 domain-containing protein [Nonomuraea sp. NPDC046802]|uniref:DUF4158 domain-containing protein n=1 Tax=Nonomuraea sp. NPDC046802 TaxID=3154919 RepID=UPI0033F1F762